MRPRRPSWSDRHPALSLLVLGALVASLAWASLAFGSDPVAPTQRGRTWNQLKTSTANAPVSITITPTPAEMARLYAISAFCTGGTASVSVTNGGSFSNGWVSSAALIATTSVGVAWTPAPFTGRLGAALVVTVSACGGTDTATLTVQADTYAP